MKPNKAAVENLLTLVKEEPKDIAAKLKATVGELRQLSNKKAGLQKRVDNAKDQYKLLLGELKMVQEPEAYAKLLKDETKDAALLEVAVDDDVNEHVLKALAQSMLKRRKRSDGQQSG